MARALRNAVASLEVDLATASAMASGNPARFMGIDDSFGKIAPGARADFVVLDQDLEVSSTWIGGASDISRGSSGVSSSSGVLAW